MPSLAEYFLKNRYIAKYNLGDRIRGVYQGIPFSGTVGNDTLISDDEGPYVTVHLDLPIKIEESIRNILKVKHSDIINIKDKYDITRKTNSKKPTVGSSRRGK